MSDSPLRDEKYILRAEALIKLALMGFNPGKMPPIDFIDLPSQERRV